MKIILLSQCKTGTSTFVRTMFHVKRWSSTGWMGRDVVSDCGCINYEAVLGTINDPKKGPFNIIHDDPIPFMYREMYYIYGDSAKYILTYRNDEAWVESFYNDFAYKPIYSRKALLYGYPMTEPFKDDYKRVYRERNEEIINFYKKRKVDFMHMDIIDWVGDGFVPSFTKIFDFLGEPYDPDELDTMGDMYVGKRKNINWWE